MIIFNENSSFLVGIIIIILTIVLSAYNYNSTHYISIQEQSWLCVNNYERACTEKNITLSEFSWIQLNTIFFNPYTWGIIIGVYFILRPFKGV